MGLQLRGQTFSSAQISIFLATKFDIFQLLCTLDSDPKHPQSPTMLPERGRGGHRHSLSITASYGIMHLLRLYALFKAYVPFEALEAVCTSTEAVYTSIGVNET